MIFDYSSPSLPQFASALIERREPRLDLVGRVYCDTFASDFTGWRKGHTRELAKELREEFWRVRDASDSRRIVIYERFAVWEVPEWADCLMEDLTSSAQDLTLCYRNNSNIFSVRKITPIEWLNRHHILKARCHIDGRVKGFRFDRIFKIGEEILDAGNHLLQCLSRYGFGSGPNESDSPGECRIEAYCRQGAGAREGREDASFGLRVPARESAQLG